MARIGDSRLQFGVNDEVWGYVQNLTENETSEKLEAQNGEGNKVAVEYFNVGEKAVSGSYFWLDGDHDGPGEKVGDITGCTITGVTGTIYIDSASKTRSVGAWKAVDFEGVYYPHLVNS